MFLTRKADYAVIAMLYLATQLGDKFIPAKNIAKKQHIPPKFIPQIIQDLSKANLVQTSRGNQGGVRISRPISQINIKDIIEAIDGPKTLNICLSSRGSLCESLKTCPMWEVWDSVQKKMLSVLEKTTLNELIKKSK